MKCFSLMLLPLFIFGQYQMKKDVISSGGTRMTSVDYVLNGTVSQTTIGDVTGGNYKAIIGFWHSFDYWPPIAPNIITVQKTGSDARLVWNKIATDTLGNVEIIDYYIVYRSTTPNYIPGLSDSIGYASPDTFYTDAGVVPSGTDYYYLVKAVDFGPNRSNPSNMGFKFRQTLNENATNMDQNWTSLPYRNNYPNASDFLSDISVDICYGVRKLNPLTQAYTSCWWDPDLLEFVDDYATVAGQMYEVSVNVDSAVRITGAHDPNLNVALNENAANMDQNWISFPYNNIYSNASDVITDISIDICYAMRKLNPLTQAYTSCWWDPDLLEFVDDYPLVRGTGYELSINTDMSWKPDVYMNRGGGLDIVSVPVKERIGTLALVKKPDWDVKEAVGRRRSEMQDDTDVAGDIQNTDRMPNLLRGRIMNTGNGMSFICYIIDRPEELLNEDVVSCGIRTKNKLTKWWAEIGNMPSPWQAGEEAVIVFNKQGYYGVTSYELTNTVDVVDLSAVELQAIPKVMVKHEGSGVELTWTAVDDPLVLGYSLYKTGNDGVYKRINNEIIRVPYYNIANNESEGRYSLQLVFAGGWESGFYKKQAIAHTDGVQGGDNMQIPVQFALSSAAPNPFQKTTVIKFAVAQARKVDIKLYDAAGKLVKVLKHERLEPGYYQVVWNGRDDLDRVLGSGIYFCKLVAGGYEATQKIILTR